MAWKECDLVSSRREFAELASFEGVNMSILCGRFGISRKTGYKWLARYRTGGDDPLADRSRRPHGSHAATPPEVEAAVLAARDLHPAWGGRKLHHWLRERGRTDVPAPSTITAILRRHGRLNPEAARPRRDWVRFEYPEPNDLWRMDFKGEFLLSDGGWCFPLTTLDDHSRFALGVRACGDQTGATVRHHLTEIFRVSGLPRAILADNGGPWGVSHTPETYTKLTVWPLRQGVRIWHGRPYHPQTQGKDERFHRTLDVEAIRRGPIDNLSHAQKRFDPWRDVYNHERPHEALKMAVPSSRYHVSARAFQETLPPVEYADDVLGRRVKRSGQFSFRGRTFKVSEAFGGERVGLRATVEDGVWDLLHGAEVIGRVDFQASGTGTRLGTSVGRPVKPTPAVGSPNLRTGPK